MNTRRKFLFNGSMAATALLTAKPFTSIANTLSPVTGYSINNNSLVLAHTGNNAESAYQHISYLKKNNANLLMLHAGNESGNMAAYDASLTAGENCSIAANDYRIVYKGNIKTGIISTEGNSFNKINELAQYLKETKDCHVVVCLSQLGYKATNGLNDLELAASSTYLDVIIGGHATDFCKSPVVARNKNKGEVIINHAADNSLALRKIEIGFDESGRKNQVAFTKSVQQA